MTPASLFRQQGRLAQSEERYVHIVEVVGSRPASPTSIKAFPTVVAVIRSCEKLGCNEPAEVAYGIDRIACVVWLENFDADDARHLNTMCAEHAARLTLPRGWTFDDRREASPRLFNSPRAKSTARVTQLPKPVEQLKPATRSAGAATTKPTQRSGNKTGGVPRRTSRETVAPMKRYDGPGLFDPTVPMTSPLSRVAESVATPVTTNVVPTAAAPEPATAPDGAIATDGATAPETPKYEPRFDRTSDVGGVLNATGRLLRRAFNSQTKPIERPEGVSDTESLPQGDHIDDFHQGDHVE